MKKHKSESEDHKENVGLGTDEKGINVPNESAEGSGIKAEEAEKGVADNNREDEISKLNDRYLRLAADFDNFRRRTLKERQDLILSAGEDLIIAILPVLDDFERAFEMLHKANGDNSTAIEGTEIIYKKLLSILTSKGLKVIDAIGKDLDTDFHEAIAQIPVSETKKKNKVVEVLQKGYTLNSKVIRFAKVVVGQ